MVATHLKDINDDLKKSSPYMMRYTRAQFGPGILTPFLEENWDLIPSAHTVLDTTNMSDMVQLQDNKIRDLTDLTEKMNSDTSKLQDKLKIPCNTVLAKIWGDYENVCKLRKKKDTVLDNKPKDELEKVIQVRLADLHDSLDNIAFNKITPKGIDQT